MDNKSEDNKDKEIEEERVDKEKHEEREVVQPHERDDEEKNEFYSSRLDEIDEVLFLAERLSNVQQ